MPKPVYLYVTPFFPSPTGWRGGFCLDAVRAIRADGRYEVVVMTASGTEGDYDYDGIPVFQCPRRRFRSAEYFETLLAGVNDRLFLSKLRQVIDPARVKVCHVHDYEHYVQYAQALKRVNPSCTTLVHHHYAGFYTLSVGKAGVVPVWSDLVYLRMRRAFESVDGHVFISEHSRRKYGRRVDFDTGRDMGELRRQLPWGAIYRPFRLGSSFVAYNLVNPLVFHPGLGGRRRAPGSAVVVGCVGNFNPCKSQIDLLRAVEILRRCGFDASRLKVRFVGGGRMLPACRDYVARHGMGDAVDFLEPMQHDRLADFYRGLDLLVTPSVNEGFCCVNAEANACGVPVIAVKGLPIEEVLSEADRAKWLYAAHDAEALADKIAAFCARPTAQRFAVDLREETLMPRFLDWVESLSRRNAR